MAEASTAVERTSLGVGQSTARVINGAWQLATDHGSPRIERSRYIDDMIRLAEAGFTTFDCADIYTGVEELLGDFGRAWRAGGREGDRIQIHTKFVPDLATLASLAPTDIECAIERSLTRLGVERLDLVQFYWWDWSVPGWLEAASTLERLRAAGKIRSLGVTNLDVQRLSALLEAGIPVVSNQVQYSLLDQRPENGMIELCDRWDLELLCYGSIAGGFLSDRYLGREAPAEPMKNRSLTKYRLIIDEFGGWPRYQELLSTLRAIARRHGVTVANVAGRWVLDRSGVAAIIVGSKDARRLDENLRLFDLRLDDSDRAAIDLHVEAAPGPGGDIFGLETDRNGPHWAILRTGLHEAKEGEA